MAGRGASASLFRNILGVRQEAGKADCRTRAARTCGRFRAGGVGRSRRPSPCTAARPELGVCVTLSRRPWTLSRRRAGVWCQRSDLEKSPANAHHRAPRAAGACIAPPLCHKAGRQLLRTRLVRPGARRHATRCVDAEDGRARQAVRGERVRLVGRLEAGEAARCIHHLRTLSPGTVILATF